MDIEPIPIFEKKEQKLYYSSLDILINISKFLDSDVRTKCFEDILRGRKKKREKKKRSILNRR